MEKRTPPHELDDSLDVTDSASSSKSNAESLKKSIHFGTLQIRHYPMIPGDNPAVIMGCPVAIDWHYDGEVTIPIDEYEEKRTNPPRSMLELRMPSRIREDLLRKLGFSRSEIQKSTKEATIGRNRRKKTEQTMQLAPFHEMLEKAKRGTLNLTIRRGAKKQEKLDLNEFTKEPKKGAERRMSSKTSHTLDTSVFSLSTFNGTRVHVNSETSA